MFGVSVEPPLSVTCPPPSACTPAAATKTWVSPTMIVATPPLVMMVVTPPRVIVDGVVGEEVD